MNLKFTVKICSLCIAMALVLFAIGCKDKEDAVPMQEKGIVIDVEGNIYKTTKIGNQWWMAENLKVKKYRDSTSIPQSQSANDWQDSTAAFCVYDNNSSNEANYGLLYNFYAVANLKKIAPIGWHIPSDDEWKALETNLGMSADQANKTSWRGYNEGEKMKAVYGALVGWTKSGSIWNTNESGFTAVAGGCRIFTGAWGDPGLFATGFWWSSTIHQNQAWYRYLDYKNANVFRYYGSKNYGFSIRCVKD